jgi:type I restriction enzyme M protein
VLLRALRSIRSKRESDGNVERLRLKSYQLRVFLYGQIFKENVSKIVGLDLWIKASQIEPAWVRDYLLTLYKEVKDNPFTAEEASNIFAKAGLKLDNVYKVLSPLLNLGVLKNAGKAPDGRALYQITLKTGQRSKTPSKDELLRLLKDAADIIRTAVPYEVILLLLFYKVVSDKWESLVNKYIEEGFTPEQAYLLANTEYLTLYDQSAQTPYTWRYVTRKDEGLANLEYALIKVAEMNSRQDLSLSLEELRRLIDKVGLPDLVRKDDLRPIIVELVQLFDKFDFSQVDYDIIGDAYQWILAQFAPIKAKEGETYTPREVVSLMVMLLDPENHSTVVDPACGSASMLIETYRYVKEKYGEAYLRLYGQDRNGVMVAISKINILLHGVKSDTMIYFGDSLTNPEFLRDLGEAGADYAIANPPWNQDGYGEDALSKPDLRKIYKYGYPPSNSADWAWIQLMLYTARKKAVVVIDQGALFRGGREREIRSKIVAEDLVEAVILLPEKLFYNTQAPGVIIVFNENKPPERKGKILFINASNEYKPHPEIRRLNILGDDNINKITKTNREFTEVPGFSKIVPIEELRKYDYNLNVTLYVTPTGEEDIIDLVNEWEELKRIEQVRQELMNKINHIMNEITKALDE